VYVLYLAYRDPRVPWYAKALAACVVGYAFSPIDLIPDPIPIIGHLDDLVLIPLGVLAVRRMIPASVMAECRERAHVMMQQGKPVSRAAAVLIVTLWVVAAAAVVWLMLRLVGTGRYGHQRVAVPESTRAPMADQSPNDNLLS
jgi:uncharacterized membrane protein YkvA (DUF1232 family)